MQRRGGLDVQTDDSSRRLNVAKFWQTFISCASSQLYYAGSYFAASAQLQHRPQTQPIDMLTARFCAFQQSNSRRSRKIHIDWLASASRFRVQMLELFTRQTGVRQGVGEAAQARG